MESSDAVRKKPVTIGPYYMSNIVTGESVDNAISYCFAFIASTMLAEGTDLNTNLSNLGLPPYLPNEYYYGGKPKLDKLVFKSVPSASIVEAMKAKQIVLFRFHRFYNARRRNRFEH
jgi:peptide/nickel transport system substrate-binding protein